jgi:hypothetical protein
MTFVDKFTNFDELEKEMPSVEYYIANHVIWVIISVGKTVAISRSCYMLREGSKSLEIICRNGRSDTLATVLNSSESERHPFYGFRLLFSKSVALVHFYSFIRYVCHNFVTIQTKLDNPYCNLLTQILNVC